MVSCCALLVCNLPVPLALDMDISQFDDFIGTVLSICRKRVTLVVSKSPAVSRPALVLLFTECFGGALFVACDRHRNRRWTQRSDTGSSSGFLIVVLGDLHVKLASMAIILVRLEHVFEVINVSECSI